MVVFNPPIGAHLVIPLPITPASNSPASWIKSIDIQFKAQDLDKKLQPGDKVEVWTDAPDKTGREIGWRAIPFDWVGGLPEGTANQDQDQEFEAENPAQQREKLDKFTIQATNISSPGSSANLKSDPSRRLMAKISLPLPSSSPTRSFEYTFRITYPDGGIWWLGGVGANGTVSFGLGSGKHGTLDEPGEQDLDFGTRMWQGWTGWGLELAGDGDADQHPNWLFPSPSTDDSHRGTTYAIAHLWRRTPGESEGELGFYAFSPNATETIQLDQQKEEEEEQVVLLPRDPASGFRLQDKEEEGFGYDVVLPHRSGPVRSSGSTLPLKARPTLTGQRILAICQPIKRDVSKGNGRVFVFSQSPSEREDQVHTVEVAFPGTEASGMALWNQETASSIFLPKDQVGAEIRVSLELLQKGPGRSVLAQLDRVVMRDFDGTNVLGYVGSALRSMDWVAPTEKEVKEDFEEVVLVPAFEHQTDHKEYAHDDHALNSGLTISRDESTWATVGSSTGTRSMSVSETGTEVVKDTTGEEGMMSPRTVDLHEVEDEDAEDDREVSGIEAGLNKNDVMREGSRSETDTDDAESETSTVSKDGLSETDRDPPVALHGAERSVNPVFRTFRWIAIMLRGLWMRTLGGFFRWMVAKFSKGEQGEGTGGGARIVEDQEAHEQTPLLDKDRKQEPVKEEREETIPSVTVQPEGTLESYDNLDSTALGLVPDPQPRTELPGTFTPAPPPVREPVYKVITQTRTRRILEPGYMKLVSGQMGRVTLLTDLSETLRIIHHQTGQTGGVERVLDVEDVRGDANGLRVLRVDTRGLPDPFELRIQSVTGDAAEDV